MCIRKVQRPCESTKQDSVDNGCRQQGHAGSKTLHQENLPVLNWRCQLMHVCVYDGCEMMDVVVVVGMCITGQKLFPTGLLLTSG